MDTHEHTPRNGWLQSKRLTWVLLGVLTVGALFLVTSNTTRLLSLWPFAFFLLCPLMMLFMMKGMQGMGSGHGGRDGRDGSDEQSRE